METSRVSAMRALAHPLRVRIVSMLAGTPMCAAEVARELGISHANAAYHMKVLRNAGELVEAGEEVIRGGVAKRYIYPDKAEPLSEPTSSASTEDHAAYARAVHREVEVRLARRRASAPGFAYDVATWVPVEVWRRALRQMQQTAELLHAQARPAGSQGCMPISATAIAFAMEEP